MADKKTRQSDNPTGKYYVDESCINCDLCMQEAPDNFDKSADGTHCFVKAQPTSPEQVAQCEEAKGKCPSDAIGNDGDA